MVSVLVVHGYGNGLLSFDLLATDESSFLAETCFRREGGGEGTGSTYMRRWYIHHDARGVYLPTLWLTDVCQRRKSKGFLSTVQLK